MRLARRSGLNAELVMNLAVYVALGGLAGAKVLMIIYDWHNFTLSQFFSLSTLQSAGVFQGGLILAFVVAILYMHYNKLPFLKTLDAFAPGVALGHSIGRLGCFSAGCCWGKETHLPWAVTFHNPDAWAITGVPLEVPLHPSQLYEFGTEAILFGFLYWRFNRAHEPGKIMGLYLVFASIARFMIEFTRAPEETPPFGLPFSPAQWICVATALAGIVMLTWPGWRSKVPRTVPA